MKKFTLLLLIIFAFNGCSSSNSNDYYTEENGEKVEIGNPYSSGTGHYEGYEWAERTEGDCSGNSASFNEGCEEYYRQIE